MPRTLRPDVVRRVQRLALANGGRLRTFQDGSPSRTVEWDIGGICLSPVRVELVSRGEAERGVKHVVVSTQNRPNYVSMEVRCRKCEACLRQKGIMWRDRSLSEYHASHRTWLCTLTLAPGTYAHLLSKARFWLKSRGVEYEGIPELDRWLAVEKFGFDDVQLWLKRIRKNSGVPLRYLAITEAHKSGVPHWHVLLHEPTEQPLRHAKLKGSWENGFANYKLVADARSAGYVTKYLSKEMRARVRASQKYGGGMARAQEPTDMPP